MFKPSNLKRVLLRNEGAITGWFIIGLIFLFVLIIAVVCLGSISVYVQKVTITRDMATGLMQAKYPEMEFKAISNTDNTIPFGDPYHVKFEFLADGKQRTVVCDRQNGWSPVSCDFVSTPY